MDFFVRVSLYHIKVLNVNYKYNIGLQLVNNHNNLLLGKSTEEGSGNGIRKKILMRKMAEEMYGMPIAEYEEEAAYKALQISQERVRFFYKIFYQRNLYNGQSRKTK